MPVPIFPPRKDSELLTWSDNFSTLITATPVAFGLVAGQATSYAALNTTWADAYETANKPSTNSKANIIAKNQAKYNLLRGPGGAWELVDIVQAFPGTTDAMRGELGLRIKDVEPTPVPAPADRPVLTIIATMNRVVKIRLSDLLDNESRGKPEGVDGATILFHAGATAPTDPAQWVFLANTSKTVVDVELPASVPAGTVWVTAFWFNQRKQASPPATPQSTAIGGNIAAAA